MYTFISHLNKVNGRFIHWTSMLIRAHWYYTILFIYSACVPSNDQQHEYNSFYLSILTYVKCVLNVCERVSCLRTFKKQGEDIDRFKKIWKWGILVISAITEKTCSIINSIAIGQFYLNWVWREEKELESKF